MSSDRSSQKYKIDVTLGQVARYALLPGIMPRLNRLAFGVQKILFSFTQMFVVMGLISPNHPSVQPENMGRYRFFDIICMAWANIRFNRKNIPQIIMFSAVMLTLLLLSGFFVVLAMRTFLYVGFAKAQASSAYFETPTGTGVDYKENQDWISIFLKRIFGETGDIKFWSSEATPANKFFTDLFSGMMHYYSNALFGLAAFMILYILMMAIVEAAKTGEPFGKQFDGLWAPIRMAIALFLLAPGVTGTNYNTAQYIVFQVSEWGNNLANNVWQRTIKSLGDTPAAGQNAQNLNFVGIHEADPGYRFVRDVFLIHICMKGYDLLECSGSNEAADPVIPRDGRSGPYMVYQFGTPRTPSYCGALQLPILYKIPKGAPGNNGAADSDAMSYFPNKAVEGYTTAVAQIINPDSEMAQIADKMVDAYVDDDDVDLNEIADANAISKWIRDYRKVAFGHDAAGNFFGNYRPQLTLYNRWIAKSLEKDAEYGWGTAGVFYLRMSNAVSIVRNAINDYPVVTHYPINLTRAYASPDYAYLTNEMAQGNCEIDDDMDYCDDSATSQVLHSLLLKANDWFVNAPVMIPSIYETLGAINYVEMMRIPQLEEVEESNSPKENLYTSLANRMISLAKIDNSDLHPLAAVISWGNSLIDSAMIMYLVSAAAGLISSAIVKAFSFGILSASLTGIASIAMDVGHMLLIPGFILSCVIPLLPFIYFIFAVMEWIISVVEAVIGMPLWALSLISGEGDLAGKSINGIKMVFEIMIRPVYIIFGLIISILIFTASVTYINSAFALFIAGMGEAGDQHMGFAASTVGGLSVVIIYMFVVYSLAISSFKLIEELPEKFIRWINLPKGFNSSIRYGANKMREQLLGAAVLRKLTGMFGK